MSHKMNKTSTTIYSSYNPHSQSVMTNYSFVQLTQTFSSLTASRYKISFPGLIQDVSLPTTLLKSKTILLEVR